MPTNFPTSVDNFTNPTANDSLNLPSHSTQHANANDAIEAIETFLLNGGQGLTHINTTTFTAQNPIVVSNVFTSAYANYQIVCNYTNSNNAVEIQTTLASGGVPLGNGNYASVLQRIRSDAGATSIQTSANGFYLGSGSNTETAGSFVMNVYNPQATARTFTTAMRSGRETDSLNYGYTCFGQTQNTNSYDGFILAASSGTLTGTIRFFGVRNS